MQYLGLLVMLQKSKQKEYQYTLHIFAAGRLSNLLSPSLFMILKLFQITSAVLTKLLLSRCCNRALESSIPRRTP